MPFLFDMHDSVQLSNRLSAELRGPRGGARTVVTRQLLHGACVAVAGVLINLALASDQPSPHHLGPFSAEALSNISKSQATASRMSDAIGANTKAVAIDACTNNSKQH